MHVNARAIIERMGPDGPEVLLQTRDKPGEAQLYELPGGRVEEYESVVDALGREVREETGLSVSFIEGLDTRVEDVGQGTRVECVRPLAVYQTLEGPIDSMGVYFRCRAEGDLLSQGHDAKDAFWAPVGQVEFWIDTEPDRFCWIDRAGLR